MRLVCPIKLKNHIPEVQQVHFTGPNEGLREENRCESVWMLAVLRGSGGATSDYTTRPFGLLLSNQQIQVIQNVTYRHNI